MCKLVKIENRKGLKIYWFSKPASPMLDYSGADLEYWLMEDGSNGQPKPDNEPTGS